MDLGKYKHLGFSIAIGSLLLVGLFLFLNGTPQTACAGSNILFVTPAGSGDCSQAAPCGLQTALGMAGDGATLYVASGVYTGTGGAVVTVTKTIALYGGWDGTLTTPPVRDPATYCTVLDGEDARRVVYISGAGDIFPTLEGFTITRGNATGVTSNPRTGGGIYSSYANPIIQNNVIVSNTANADSLSGAGGGIYLLHASATTLVSGNQVLSNTNFSSFSTWGGGGLYIADSDANILGNLIQGNHCTRAGGGIYVKGGAPRILGNEIRSNTSDANGGGIYARFDGQMYVEDNWIVDNVAGSYGGGVHVTYDSQPTLVANHIFRNTANSDGGVLIETNGYYTVTNNFIAHNGDVGIRVWYPTEYGLIAHNTVAFNTGSKGGIVLDSGTDYMTPTVVNNIVVSNTYGIRAQSNASGTLDYNDVWGNTVQDYDLPGALDPGPHDIQGDPLFVGPYVDDFHLQAGSPCIDVGLDVGVSADIDSDLRPINICYDIGADEFRLRHLYLPLVVRAHS